jgi:hypothetical protein
MSPLSDLCCLRFRVSFCVSLQSNGCRGDGNYKPNPE